MRSTHRWLACVLFYLGYAITRRMLLRPDAGDTPRRVHFGLDYFDASINRIDAWVIGTRIPVRSLLLALLEPPAIPAAEHAGDNTARLALQEEARSLPFGVAWDFHCETKDVPVRAAWRAGVRKYEADVLVSCK